MSQKVLVADDEHSVVTLLKYNLEATDYEVVVAFDGDETLEKVESERSDLTILDIILPKRDDIDVYKTVRTNKNLVPISVLTAENDEFSRVLGLELGADDYVIKPFSPRGVVAHVRTILRHSQLVEEVEEIDDDITIGPIRVRPGYPEVYKHNELSELTPKELELLLYLIEGRGGAITREHMLNTVWNYEFAGGSRIVDVHISHLGGKSEGNPKKPRLTKAVRGLGYRLERPKKQ